MARSYGKIHASLASDVEFNSLPVDAAYLYLRLLGLPSLTLAGCVDYRPAKWAAYAYEWTRDDVEAAVEVLEERRYLVVDRGTEEALIRTLTRHDGIPVGNPKLRKGLWAAWHSIASPQLRKVAVDNMPAELFLHADTPQAAVDLRWSQQTDSGTDYPVGQANGSGTDSPVSVLLSPSTASGSVRELTETDIATGKAGLAAVQAAFQRSGSSAGGSNDG